MNARRRYNELQSERAQFLDVANKCAELTLPYLMKNEGDTATHTPLKTPWQSIGAKAVVTSGFQADACTAATTDHVL